METLLSDGKPIRNGWWNTFDVTRSPITPWDCVDGIVYRVAHESGTAYRPRGPRKEHGAGNGPMEQTSVETHWSTAHIMKASIYSCPQSHGPELRHR